MAGTAVVPMTPPDAAGEPPAASAMPVHLLVSAAAAGLSLGTLVWLVCTSTMAGPLPLLYAALIAFGVSSLVWAFVQFWYADALASWMALATAGVLLAVGGTALLVYRFATPADGLPLIGFVLCYAGLGWLVGWLRQQGWALAWGKWLLLAGAVVGLVAALTLPHVRGAGYLALLGVIGFAVLLMIPVGLNLASEDAMHAVTKLGLGTLPGPLAKITVRSAVVFGAGLVLAGAVIVAAEVAGHSWKVAALATLIALALMAAIVSDTHLDIAMVIAALALLAAAPPQEAVPAKLDPGAGQSVLVALGDSYMSGEGAARFYAGTDDGGGNECRRAPTAYAALAAGPGQRFDHVTFLACSGARTYNVIGSTDDSQARPQPGEGKTQVDQLLDIKAAHPSFKPRLVIVSVGGNDAGFATIGEACLAPGNCATQRQLFEDLLPEVRRSLVATYASIEKALPGVPIVAVPYPQPIAAGSACNGLPLSKSERAFISDFVEELDGVIHKAADDSGLYFMDTMEGALASAHRQLCDPQNHGHPGIYPVTLASVSGLANQRFSPLKWTHDSLHPNALGHAALLATFNKWLADHPVSAPATTHAPSVTATPPTDPPCSFSASGSSNCQTQTRAWELRQTAGLWPWGIAVLAGLIAVWLVSVAVLGLRRSYVLRADAG